MLGLRYGLPFVMSAPSSKGEEGENSISPLSVCSIPQYEDVLLYNGRGWGHLCRLIKYHLFYIFAVNQTANQCCVGV